MNKILIISIIVVFGVIILGSWLFFGKFGDFTGNIRKGSEEIILSEKTKFIGTWETEYIQRDDRFVGYNGIYIFSSNQEGSIGGLICNWNLTDNKVVIKYQEDTATLTYDYTFLDNYDTLKLSNSNGILIFNKK